MADIGENLTNDDIIPVVDDPTTTRINKRASVGAFIAKAREGILDNVGGVSIFYSNTAETITNAAKALEIESTLVSDGVTLIPTEEGVGISHLDIENAGTYRIKYTIGFKLDNEAETDKKVLAYLTSYGTTIPCSVSSAFLRKDQDYAQLTGTAVIYTNAHGTIGVNSLSDSTQIKTADNSIQNFTPTQYKLMISVERIK